MIFLLSFIYSHSDWFYPIFFFVFSKTRTSKYVLLVLRSKVPNDKQHRQNCRYVDTYTRMMNNGAEIRAHACCFIIREMHGSRCSVDSIARNRTGKSTRIARSNLSRWNFNEIRPENSSHARALSRASSSSSCSSSCHPFSESAHSPPCYFSPKRFRIACLKHESDIIARRAILPRSYGAVRKGTPAIDDRETDEVNTHDRAGMLIG